MKHFQISEIEFNDHSGVVKPLLKESDDFSHVLSGFHEQDSFAFNIEFFFQIFRNITRVSHEYSFQILVKLHKLRPVPDVARSEGNRQYFSFQVGGDVQFEPIIQAFPAMPPFSQSFHRFMAVGVFIEANGDVGGVGVFYRMGVLPVFSENDLENDKSQEGTSVHIHDKGLVAALQDIFEVVPD